LIVVIARALKQSIALSFFIPLAAFATEAVTPGDEFVEINKVDPSIVIDLRYATPNNVTHRPLYPPGTPALLRAGVAQRLVLVQKYLRKKKCGLKIWDAYRPASAQHQLWQATQNGSYVADPDGARGSMHLRGVAVDATLIDEAGRDLAMPTEFDNFTPAALINYQGSNPVVRSNLNLLQKAMAHGGFYGLRTEWWHFCAPDWKRYPQVPELKFGLSSRTKSRDPVTRRKFFFGVLRLRRAPLRMTGTVL
jgi:D-alanyl-D-alanine dipeptidase